MDEILGFGEKGKHARPDDPPEVSSVWTFCAIDAYTKLIPAFCVGDRDTAAANAFLADVSGRIKSRVLISTDDGYPYRDSLRRS
jgi:IS1 family transposase